MADGDYNSVTMTVVFPAGSTSQTVDVQTNNDGIAENTESFGVRLSNPTNGLVVGSQDTANILIMDDSGKNNNFLFVILLFCCCCCFVVVVIFVAIMWHQ